MFVAVFPDRALPAFTRHPGKGGRYSLRMALHPELPTSPYAVLPPEQRWFPADESLRERAYEKLLPPLVANIRREVQAWRSAG